MGFHLWVRGNIAFAQGTYEYRPLGVAVISASDLFRRRDFQACRRVATPGQADYVGQFASIGHVNQALRSRLGSEAVRKPLRRSKSPASVLQGGTEAATRSG